MPINLTNVFLSLNQGVLKVFFFPSTHSHFTPLPSSCACWCLFLQWCVAAPCGLADCRQTIPARDHCEVRLPFFSFADFLQLLLFIPVLHLLSLSFSSSPCIQLIFCLLFSYFFLFPQFPPSPSLLFYLSLSIYFNCLFFLLHFCHFPISLTSLVISLSLSQ